MTAKKSRAGSRDRSRLPKPPRTPGPQPASIAGRDIIPAKSPWPPPPAPGLSSAAPVGEAESIDYLWAPAGPPAGPGLIIVKATVPRAGLARVVIFELDWERLDTAQRTQAYGLLARHGEGLEDHPKLAVSLLYDLSLQQTHPAMSHAERQEIIGEALTIPERETSPLALLAAQRPPRPPATMGVSPLLPFINRHARKRLLNRHQIDVRQLQQESQRLHQDIYRFWEISPPESLEPGEFFSQAAEKFNRLLVLHHEKVRRIGALLGGDLGRALAAQADAGIRYLQSHLPNRP
jgi:hypothetical protein